MVDRRELLKGAGLGTIAALLGLTVPRTVTAFISSPTDSPLATGFSTESETFEVSTDTVKSAVLKIFGVNPQTGISELMGLVTQDGGNGNGYGEVALGQGAMSKWAPGMYLGDTAIGYQALMNDVGGGLGASNTAVGFQTLLHNIDGESNCAFGVFSMHQNVHGFFNAAFGELSMFWQTGSYNTAFGRCAGYGLPGAAGSWNTYIGEECGHVNQGNRNTSFGAQTMFENQHGDGMIVIGYQAGYYDLGSDHLWIWDRTTGSLAGDLVSALIYGEMADSPSNQKLVINARTTVNGLLSYTNAKGATEVLQDKIDALEARIRELEAKVA